MSSTRKPKQEENEKQKETTISNKPLCFVISPLGDEGTKIRKNADDLLDFIIKPVCTPKFEVDRADNILESGSITTKVINRVIVSQFLIADVTEANPNVFYELAIRHAFAKPYFQLIKRGGVIPFDVAHTRTIYYDITDMRDVESVKEKLAGFIESSEKKAAVVETPVTVAGELAKLKSSDQPDLIEMADILEGVTDLKSAFQKMDQKLFVMNEEFGRDLSSYLRKILRPMLRDVLDKSPHRDKPMVVLQHETHQVLMKLDRFIHRFPKFSDDDTLREIWEILNLCSKRLERIINDFSR